MKSFLIIGMDTFGHHLCRELSKHKCEIMVADVRPEAVEDVLPMVVSAKVGDCTNEEVLKSFGVGNFDACFVCMGSDFQNSLQITSLLKELGAVKVLSKADNDIHAKFLKRNGADEVMYPDHEAAARIAVSESSDSIFDCIPLTSEYSMYEIDIRDKWINKSIKELGFRTNYKLSILAIKKGGEVLPVPMADYVFRKGDHVLVMGRVEDKRKVTT